MRGADFYIQYKKFITVSLRNLKKNKCKFLNVVSAKENFDFDKHYQFSYRSL